MRFAAQNAALGVLFLGLQLVGVERLATTAFAGARSSTTGFVSQLGVPELRQPPLFVAAPLAASAVSKSESETREGKAHGKRTDPRPKCHQDLTVGRRRSVGAVEARTPCKRGVSDLGPGRGHDRRCGQISWSLTPRYYD